MTTLNKSERVIANVESVKKELLKIIKTMQDYCTDGYFPQIEVDAAKEQIPKLNAIIEIMEK